MGSFLQLPMSLFDPVGSPGLGTPTLQQKLAKLLLFHFDIPAGTPAPQDVSVRRRYTVDVFGDEPVHGRTVTLRLRGSSSTKRPQLFLLGVSWAPQADTSFSRFTAWDLVGTGADKMVKGVVLDVDTRGREREVQVQADGPNTRATFTALSAGRRVLQFAWPQFRARMVRLRPTTPTHWRLYSVQWICDEEPLALKRWETQAQNNGVLDWHTLTALHVSYSALEPVTLVIAAYNRKGMPQERTYYLEATGGPEGKRVEHVLPHALQGMLYKYTFTSTGDFNVYREESCAFIQVWGEEGERKVQPFGNDDLAAPSRDMRAAKGVASRQGGGR